MSTDLTPSQSRESEVGKHYSPTHQPPKNKIKVKVKVKIKTITGTGAAKRAGQTTLRYRSSKERGLNQPAAKTTAKRNRLNQRGQRRLHVVCVTTPGRAGVRA